MARGRTLYDLVWPSGSKEFGQLAEAFSEGVVVRMLVATWAGYDQLKKQLLSRIDVSQAEEELERAVTQLLEPKIRDQLTGEEPFYLQHGAHEFETRQSAPAQPPEYDLAFVLSSNGRIMWPLEAKVLRTEGAVSRYVKAVNDQLLTGRYAPFVKSAAMLGYLFSGKSRVALTNIEASLGMALAQHGDFGSRPHCVSTHLRRPRYGSAVPGSFECHHLIMDVT